MHIRRLRNAVSNPLFWVSFFLHVVPLIALGVLLATAYPPFKGWKCQ